MTTRVGINGFGRIGRQSLKALIERTPDVEVVAVNDLIPTSTNALLFKHDSTYGAYPGTVSHTDDSLIIDGRELDRLQQWDIVRVERGKESFRLVTLGNTNFYEAFRTKFNFRIRPEAIPSRRAGLDLTAESETIRQFSSSGSGSAS